ncbi:IS3 family transposase [Streptomyces flavovirens]|uniref:IS3 family transposase n=1 Tax=Streptomyces flavovirens TaxID=52258 RepID=UPI003D0C8084
MTVPVRDVELTEQITEVHARSRGTYGVPRGHAVLTREGAGCGRRRVVRLTRAAGLQGRHRRRRQATTIPDLRTALRPDLIARDFQLDRTGLDTRWCGNITYIPTGKGRLCLATVIGIASRRVAGWDNRRSPADRSGGRRTGICWPAASPRPSRDLPLGSRQPLRRSGRGNALLPEETCGLPRDSQLDLATPLLARPGLGKTAHPRTR